MSDIEGRLRDLDSHRSPVTWRDVESRPPGTLPPDRRGTRFASGFVAFAVFAGGGWLAWSALGADRRTSDPIGTSSPVVTVSFEERSDEHDLPRATLAFGDQVQQGVYSSFEWGDSIYDTVVPELSGFVTVPQGAELAIVGTADRVTAELGGRLRYPFGSVATLDVASGPTTLDADPGTYALIFEATWPDGTVPFYFGIEIVETTPLPQPTGSVEPNEAPRYEGNGLVLDEPKRDSVLCVGGIATSLPPQCAGIPIVGWDWDAVDGEQTQLGTTWGSYHVTGTYDGETFGLLEVGPTEPEPSEGGDPVDTPCPEPAGGWTSTDIAKAGDADMRALMRAMIDEADFAGFWIDYVGDPSSEIEVEPGGIIANVAFTTDPDLHLDEIRRLWGGPLCLVRQERTYDELRRIQRELDQDGARALGLEMTGSAVDVQTNVVQLGVVVATPEGLAAVQQRYGDAVVLAPELEPVG